MLALLLLVGLLAQDAGTEPTDDGEATATSTGETTPDVELPEELRAMFDSVEALQEAGDLDGARGLLESLVDGRLSDLLFGPRSAATLGCITAVDDLASELSLLQIQRRVRDSRVAHLARELDRDHPDLVRARADLAGALWSLGDHAAAHALFESVLAARERTLPEDHPDLVLARNDLAGALWSLGDHEAAHVLVESVLAARERTLPEGHPDILSARLDLATTLARLGDLEAARELEESVLAAHERTLPEDHPDLVRARASLATTLLSLGDFEGARELEESVLAARERTLPEDHPDLVRARNNLATTLHSMGDLEAARALLELVLATRERTLPERHTDLAHARNNLAVTLHSLGDYEAARVLQESVLAAYERTRPEDHPDLVAARSNLALTLQSLGDHEAARVLQESVLAAYERTLPEDHPHLVTARNNLAATFSYLGDHEAARGLRESALAARKRTLPEGHPDLVRIRGNLAVMLERLGDHEAARELEESVLAAYERTRPEDHPDLVRARGNLAATLLSLGDVEGALELRESVLAARERTLPEDHPGLVAARSDLAVTLVSLGDHEAARALLPELASGLLLRLAGLVATSAREAREIARFQAARRLWLVLALSQIGTQSGDRSWAFDLVESLRHVSQATPAVDGAMSSDGELAAWRAEASRLRAEQGDLVAGSSSADEPIANELGRLTTLRDRVERRIRARLAEGGHFTESIRAEDLSKALPPNSAAAGFLRYGRTPWDPETNEPLQRVPSLLAHVVRPGARPVRIELGPLVELEGLARTWRASLQSATRETRRGVSIPPPESSASDAERATGVALRRRILDPVLEAVGNANTLHVCLDDFLYLIPLDALPVEDERVGDRYDIVNEVSFARMIAPRSAPGSDPEFLALGGASFDEEPRPGVSQSPARRVPTVSPSTRGLSDASFLDLPHTRLEVRTLGALFEESFGEAPVLLTERDATKAAMHASAPGTRYLHLATHGWFAPESVPSMADEPSIDELWQQSAAEAITGLAPMTLCGLALAGANTGPDEKGRVPGILTAEELASIDLSACELAVLSACETNVGLRRAGQGIQSLQSALYTAGARTSITSLWRVDDALTRRLMELFYSNLWLAKMPKAKALWAAKRALRDEGAAVRDWAGWVLTGNPD